MSEALATTTLLLFFLLLVFLVFLFPMAFNDDE